VHEIKEDKYIVDSSDDGFLKLQIENEKQKLDSAYVYSYIIYTIDHKKYKHEPCNGLLKVNIVCPFLFHDSTKLKFRKPYAKKSNYLDKIRRYYLKQVCFSSNTHQVLI
jgi:hypothetical protein